MDILNYPEYRLHIEECMRDSISRFNLHYNESLVNNLSKNYEAFLENDYYRIELNTTRAFPNQWVDIKIYALEGIVREIPMNIINEALNISSDDIMRISYSNSEFPEDNEYQKSLRELNAQLIAYYSPFFEGKVKL
jgi:hypothetical protein